MSLTDKQKSASPAQASTNLKEILYVQASRGGELSVIDFESLKVIDSVQIGQEGDYVDDVISSNSEDMLYLSIRKSVAEPPNEDLPIALPGGEVIAVSTESHEIEWRMEVSGQPHHLLISPDDRYIYQPIFDSNYLEVIDVQQRKTIKKVPVGIGSHGTRLSRDGKRLYVGCMTNDHIRVVDTESYKVLKTIPFSEGVRPFNFTSDEKRLFVQLSKLHGFDVVDLETDQITQRVFLPELSPSTQVPKEWNHTVNHGMNITSDDKLLFAAGSVEHYVAVYSLPEIKLITTIPTGKEPNWIIFSKDEKYCMITNRAEDTVSIISVDELKEVERIKVGYYPQRMTTVMKSLD